jgi:hypothetical protein
VIGRYRTWSVAKWDRDPFQSLTPMQRYLYLTLHLGPFSTALPGVSVCGPAALHEAAGNIPDFQDQLRALNTTGVLLHEGRLFVLPDVIAEAVPTNPNQVKAWRTAFDELPAGTLKQQIDGSIRQLLITHGEAHPVTFKDGRPADPCGYIRAWDPLFDATSANVTATLHQGPRDVPGTAVDGSADVDGTSGERSTDGAETSADHSPNVGPRLGEPEAGSGSESGSGSGNVDGRKGWGAGEGKPAKPRTVPISEMQSRLTETGRRIREQKAGAAQ